MRLNTDNSQIILFARLLKLDGSTGGLIFNRMGNRMVT